MVERAKLIGNLYVTGVWGILGILELKGRQITFDGSTCFFSCGVNVTCSLGSVIRR
jgi:hypothetical protein